MSAKIIYVRKRTKADDEEFCVLVLQGSLQILKSKATNHYYATIYGCLKS